MSLASERDRDVLRSFARRIDPSDAGAHNNLGVLYYSKGLYAEAVAAFSRALELDSRMQVAQRNLEAAYFNTGYYDRRVGELHERLRVAPTDREARWELGRTYSLLGQHRDAVRELSELVRHEPNDLGAIVHLGLAEKANGDVELAQKWFERARNIDPDSSVIHFYIGETLYNRGLNDASLASLQRAIELNPENPDAHYLKGFVLGDMGQHEEARAATARAIKLNPALSRAQANLSLDKYNPQRYEERIKARDEGAQRGNGGMGVSAESQLAHFSLGLAFRQKNYLTEALREYRIALEKGESEELVLQAMAEVHLLREDSEAALELYDKLLKRSQESPKLWNERGVILHRLGRIQEAVESYELAAEADRDYALAHNNLGVGLFQLGKGNESLEAFRVALEVQPRFTKARLNIALLLLNSKRLPLALEAYRRVLSVDAEQPIAWNGIGLILAELRKFEDARNAFGRAIQARPEFAQAHYNLSFTLTNLGDYDGALRETKRALELDPYYVPQKFELAIDLQHESAEIQVGPDVGADKRVVGTIDEFRFDADMMDSLFSELEPQDIEQTGAEAAGAYAMTRDYLSKGLLDRASAEASRAIGRGGNRAEGLHLLAAIFTRQGLYGEALERYREINRGEARGLESLQGEVRALLHLGRGREALPVAETMLEAAPDDVDTLILCSAARASAGDPVLALQALDRARRHAPARAEVLARTGDILRSMADVDSAIAAYRHALELDRDYAGVRYELARLLVSRGQLRDAERELVAALDTLPTYADATLELCALRRRTGKIQDALKSLVELLTNDPDNLNALVALGETLISAGRETDAERAFDRVLRFDAENVGALYHQGLLLAKQHRYRDAIQRWERVVDLEPVSEFARRARRDVRTASDLTKIFGTQSVA